MTVTARLVLFHKQSTSARTLFLRVGADVVLPGQDLKQMPSNNDVVIHPTVAMNTVLDTLGLDGDDIVLEGEFKASIEMPNGAVPVYLARFSTIDPPYQEAEKCGGRFIAITEARDIDPVQLNLLRHAYTCIME
jgi:hypothetical protein